MQSIVSFVFQFLMFGEIYQNVNLDFLIFQSVKMVFYEDFVGIVYVQYVYCFQNEMSGLMQICWVCSIGDVLLFWICEIVQLLLDMIVVLGIIYDGIMVRIYYC